MFMVLFPVNAPNPNTKNSNVSVENSIWNPRLILIVATNIPAVQTPHKNKYAASDAELGADARFNLGKISSIAKEYQKDPNAPNASVAKVFPFLYSIAPTIKSIVPPNASTIANITLLNS